MDKDIKDNIERKLIHISLRPTYSNINNIYTYLNALGFQNIPKIHTYQKNDTIDINEYCNKIRQIISVPPQVVCLSPKNNRKNNLFIFEESYLLPKNVYVSEKDEEERIDDNGIINDTSSIPESEHSEKEEEEVFEEGYELYESGDDEYFSD